MAKSKSKAKPKPAAKSSAKATNKPTGRNDAYTMMLFVTFVAMVLGCVLLYLDFDEYAQQKAPTSQPPAIQKLGDDASTAANNRGTGTGTGTGTTDN